MSRSLDEIHRFCRVWEALSHLRTSRRCWMCMTVIQDVCLQFLFHWEEMCISCVGSWWKFCNFWGIRKSCCVVMLSLFWWRCKACCKQLGKNWAWKHCWRMAGFVILEAMRGLKMRWTGSGNKQWHWFTTWSCNFVCHFRWRILCFPGALCMHVGCWTALCRKVAPHLLRQCVDVSMMAGLLVLLNQFWHLLVQNLDKKDQPSGWKRCSWPKQLPMTCMLLALGTVFAWPVQWNVFTKIGYLNLKCIRNLVFTVGWLKEHWVADWNQVLPRNLNHTCWILRMFLVKAFPILMTKCRVMAWFWILMATKSHIHWCILQAWVLKTPVSLNSFWLWVLSSLSQPVVLLKFKLQSSHRGVLRIETVGMNQRPNALEFQGCQSTRLKCTMLMTHVWFRMV